ncbi:NAD-dependent epimerase/dehydratase family protein [Cohnella boryungensis]|uniref:NAD-dependent epimerase/dehydratase family protein n=1 Tax=Cohnella boryungensis TaxID=768479 RepID=A0ABV8SAC2_9BACL
MRSAAQADETIVVTGVSSFIGMHLACSLTKLYRRVIGTCGRKPEYYDRLRSERLDQAVRCGVRLAPLDLTDPAQIDRFILAERPNVWVHHAGYATDYASSRYDLTLGYQVNVAPLERIYARLQEIGCRGFIATGSCMEYGDTAQACREDDSCWPSTPYGLSKLTATIRSRQLASLYGMKTRIARVFIPYGEWDSAGKLINDTVASLLRGQPIGLSHCMQKRDFIHVEDLVRGYLACIEDLRRDALYEIYNLCSGEATPVKELLLRIVQELKADPSLLRFGERITRAGEPDACFGSNLKAIERLDWRPRALEEGLRDFLGDVSPRR